MQDREEYKFMTEFIQKKDPNARYTLTNTLEAHIQRAMSKCMFKRDTVI